MAPPPGADRPRPFNPLMLILFGVVFLVLFSAELRNALGRGAGFVLDPLIGFGGEQASVTLLLASMITGVLTSVARHYMLDHVRLAKAQETIRAFQKEFSQARKDQNTYKVKRLTELQPELMRYQSELTGAQMKPMAATMLVVIPVFAWLATWIETPVAYEIEAPDEALLLAYDGGLMQATAGPVAFEAGRDYRVVAFGLEPDATGAVTVTKTTTGSVRTGDLAAGSALVNSTLGVAVTLPAGTWTVRADAGTRDEPGPSVGVARPGSDKLLRYREAVVLLPSGTGFTAVAATERGATIALDAPADARILVPIRGDEPRGSVRVLFDGPAPTEIDADALKNGFDTRAGLVVDAPPPHTMALPWNDEWDLQASWKNFFPHWILIYSLYSIPLGQLVQKGLRGWQFSKDLAAAKGA